MKADVASQNAGSQKWGVAALGGFQPLPHALLWKQRELDLDAIDLVVLLNVSSYWWFRNQPPYLRTNLIAERLGVTTRTVQRVISKLSQKGYIRREKWADEKGKTYPAIFFDGLLCKLESLTREDPVLGHRVLKALARTENKVVGEAA